jgi:hypothetical protein
MSEVSDLFFNSPHPRFDALQDPTPAEVRAAVIEDAADFLYENGDLPPGLSPLMLCQDFIRRL